MHRPAFVRFILTSDTVHRETLVSGFEPYADDMAVELVPDAGHFIAEEKPELVAARARQFLGSP